MKLKEKIKNKLIKFIGMDDLNEYITSEFKILDGRVDRASHNINSNKNDIEILNNTIRSVVSVGADVVPNNINNDRSWAVVCIEGNYNVVKFIDLHGADYKYLLDVLKQFEGSRMVVDAPRDFMFEDVFRMK